MPKINSINSKEGNIRDLSSIRNTSGRRPAFTYAVVLSFGVFSGGAIAEKLANSPATMFAFLPRHLSARLILVVIIAAIAITAIKSKSFIKIKSCITSGSFKYAFSHIVVLLVGISLMLFEHARIDMMHQNDLGDPPQIQAVIEYIDEREYGYRLTVDTEYGRAHVYWYPTEGDENRIDDYWSYIGLNAEISLSKKHSLEIPEPASSPRTFDNRRNLYGKGIYWMINVGSDGLRLMEDSEDISLYNRFKAWAIGRREAFLDRVFGEGPRTEKAFSRGVLFGDISELDEDIYESFKKNNTAHILAASGLHVGIIYQAYVGISKRIRYHLGRKTGVTRVLAISFSVFLFVYGTMTLWSPSIRRAIFLVYLKLLSDYLEERYDMVSAVGVINILMLLGNPFLIYGAGFQMSFFSAYAISVIVPRFRDKISEVLLMPLVIQGFMLLYTIRTYNTFSLIGIVANVLVIGIASLYVPIGVCGFLLFFLPVESFLRGLGNMIISIDEMIYMDGRFVWDLASPNLGIVSLYMMVIVFLTSEDLMVMIERKRKGLISIALLGILVLSLFFSYVDSSPFDEASIVFVDVGQGDAIHVNWEDEDILIDGGGRYNYNVGEKILKPYFLRNANSDLDIALATHEHMDHYKGIEELLEVYEVKELITWGEAGDVIKLDNERSIEILWPLPEFKDHDDENYYSRIFMINDRGIRTLITGDITEPGELALIREYGGTGKLDCDILKIAHHGSRFSTSYEFLKETSPSVAVISVGKNNVYGHPSIDVIEKLNDLGIIIYRTDIDGAIGVITETSEGGKEFLVCTEKTKRLERHSLS